MGWSFSNGWIMSTYLWQTFLKDISIIKSIAISIDHLYEKTWAKALVEIGPWRWAITKKIKDISQCFFVIEKDETMKEHLEGIGLTANQIIFWDVLQQDIGHLLEERGIVGPATGSSKPRDVLVGINKIMKMNKKVEIC